MALARNQHILQRITHGLFKSPSVLFSNQTTFTHPCSISAISVVSKRCYIPSLTLSQRQQTAGNTTQTLYQAQHGDSEKAEMGETKDTVEKTRTSKKDQFSRTRWTSDELNLLVSYIKKGAHLREIIEDFPDRTTSSVDTRISILRRQLNMDPWKARRSRSSNAWTEEEDEWLRKRVRQVLQEDPTSLDWSYVANGHVGDGRLGRPATSCKRRWDIIKPDSCRRYGAWEHDESRQLAKAVIEQIESLNRVDTSTGSLDDLERHIRRHHEDLYRIDWKAVASSVKTRSDIQCRSHIYKNVLSGERGGWSREEETLLKEGMQKYGTNLKKLTEIIPSRSSFQIRQKVNYELKN